MKQLLGILLSLSIAVTFASAMEPASTVSRPDSAQVTTATSKIVVYYLYFNPRCETCLNMEAYSKQAIEKGMKADVKSGRLEWHSFDIDKPEYKHFWDDYELETKALIISEMRDGKQVRWKNCDKIWDLAEDKAVFMKYVQDEVRAYLSSE